MRETYHWFISGSNTIDYSILGENLQYYRLRLSELEFFRSYFKDRMIFMDLDTKRYEIHIMGLYFVIQGLKLSSLMYSVYANKSPHAP